MSKVPKKKESKERVTSAVPSSQRHVAEPSAVGNIGAIQEEKAKKSRTPVSVWPEWSEQDIASEKWDVGHRAKVDPKSKSPSAAAHCFEDPEGKIDLPFSLKQKVYYWKRPTEFIADGKVPTVVEMESVKEKTIDLLSSNEHITGSEVIRWLISSITALTKLFQNSDMEHSAQNLKSKASKEIKDAKSEKNKKDVEHAEDFTGWRPWQLIWPKDGAKGNLTPAYNPSGKYCIKLFWMGVWRKITIDDLMPFDEDGRLLLPCSYKDNEIWPMLLSKALIKIASLDYGGGITNCEFGDWSIITCLTGWFPEPIPLKNGHKGEIWKLLLSVLPNWKLRLPCPPAPEVKQQNGDSKTVSDVHVGHKTDGSRVEMKESKDMKEGKGKKEEKDKGKSHDDKKQRDKSTEKGEKEGKGKDKGAALGSSHNKVSVSEPEFVLFASYSSIPSTPVKVSTLREMADASETLRLSGLSHNHPHTLLLTTVRNCPLVAPPTPVPIPRWKLIRQKKKKQPIESDPQPVEPPKEPQFVELYSPFINYCVSPVPVSRAPSPVKWEKFKPQTPLGSLCEENDDNQVDLIDDDEENTQENLSPSTNCDEMKNESSVTFAITNNETVKMKSKASGETAQQTSKALLAPAKKENCEDETKSIDREQGEQLSKDKKPNKAAVTINEKQVAESVKGRRASKVAEPKLSDLKRWNSKDAAKDSLKSIDGSKTPSTLVEEAVEETVPDKDQEKMEESEKCDEEVPEETTKAETQLWMDYDDFCKCFSTLWIFHKPQTYPFYKNHTEIKGLEPKTEKGKKGGALNAAVSTVAPTPIGRGQTNISPSMYGSHQPHMEPPPPYLLVDSLNNVELTVGFTSFSKWFDPPLEPLRSTKSKEKEKEMETVENDEISKENLQNGSPPAGVLVAEPYSWKSLVAGQPSLRIRTTGVKGAVLSLPAGRHFLRLMVQAPHGYHLDICSQTPFIFGDEDSVMQYLTKESCRFVHHAVATMQGLGKIVRTFLDPTQDISQDIDLGIPAPTKEIGNRHLEVFFRSLFVCFKTELGEGCPPSLTFATEALKLKTMLHVRSTVSDFGTSRQRSDSDIVRKDVNRFGGRLNSLPAPTFPELDVDDASIAAVKIQAYFRGFYVRKLKRSFDSGTEERKVVEEVLTKLWNTINANMENFSVKVYRTMFEFEPSLYPLYPFYKDEWTHIAYSDYHGTYTEQPTQSWFVVFREVFYVQKPVLVVPRMYINISSCILRVVDNDTGQDLPRVFMKVAPKKLEVNKGGYTFVAEARSSEIAIPAGKFRLRLIGSAEPLPVPAKDGSVATTFNTKEIRDYYIPNRDNIIMRYAVKVSTDQLTTIQFSTSKSDVYIKLQVLDHENEVISVSGKGHVVIPAFTFLKDITDEDDERSSRKGSRQNSRKSSPKASKMLNTKRASSPQLSGGAKPNKNAEKDSLDQSGVETAIVDAIKSTNETENQNKSVIHKYIIQANVLRDSWPLSRSQWNFVSMLKTLEKQDGEADTTRNEKEKHSAGPKGKKGAKKDVEGRTSKSHAATSRPGSQNIDTSKPSWVLRVVTDVNVGEIDVRKDTERQDEIKAMKTAWEAAEPGRAAKALQARLKFLNENTLSIETGKLSDDSEQEGEAAVPGQNDAVFPPTSPGPSEVDSTELTLEPPPKPKTSVLKPFDLSPYIRSVGPIILLDEAEEERIHMEREMQQRRFLAIREEVLKRREEDLNERNLEKERQIKLYEDLQANLDQIREAHKGLRDQYCQKYLEKPVVPAAPEVDDKKRKTPSPSRGRKTPKGKTSKSPAKGKKK